MKLTKGLVTASLVLSLGVANLAVPVMSTYAATVEFENNYKSVISHSFSELKEYTGKKNVKGLMNKLATPASWKAAGYKAAEAKVIAADFASQTYKVEALLTKMDNNKDLHFKVILLKTGYVKAEFGLESYGNSSEKPGIELPGTTEPGEETPGTELPTQAGIKKLEIELDYKQGDVELQYQVNSNGTVKAQYQNKIDRVQLQGAQAEAKLNEVLAGIDFKTASQSDIVRHVLAKLNLGSDYKQFQFQGQFTDNTKVKFKLK
ncbi:YusW family protein [uncultured Vagococcus sp.]|uniref:YusW family protein n=1 Tax=uncultured Vagococcus sp. TaxID=189676 RepID=UPI0028D3A9CA|nr:YusW family protein [uncultured Vagococcus sp.]